MENTNETKKQMEQKEAVFLAVQTVFQHANIEVSSGETRKSKITSQIRKAINEIIFVGLKAGTIRYKKDITDDKKLKNYASVLVGNWLNKDKRYSLELNYLVVSSGE